MRRAIAVPVLFGRCLTKMSPLRCDKTKGFIVIPSEAEGSFTHGGGFDFTQSHAYNAQSNRRSCIIEDFLIKCPTKISHTPLRYHKSKFYHVVCNKFRFVSYTMFPRNGKPYFQNGMFFPLPQFLVCTIQSCIYLIIKYLQSLLFVPQGQARIWHYLFQN